MTNAAKFDVLGIGNAIVDVISHADDAFLGKRHLNKGGMALIDEATAEALYGEMGPGVECSGGSAANTIAGIASLGGKAAYIGKVRNDQLGKVFAHDLKSQQVEFSTRAASIGPATARCLILVTPDAQRTMNTYLGACVGLGPDDVDETQVAASSITYLEGYLWDPPEAKKAFRKAMRIAHDAGNRIALSLSDAFCVDRWRDEFIELVEHQVDILFANEAEILSLYKTTSFEEAMAQVKKHVDVAALTRSEKGSVIIAGDNVFRVPAAAVEKVVDTTGAGDLYAAGFLYGVTHGMALPRCAELAGKCAAEVISHVGARPAVPLKSFLA